MHILPPSAKVATLLLMVHMASSIRIISILRIMGPRNKCNLAFRVLLIVVVILECGVATLDMVKTVDFLVRVLRTTGFKLQEAEVDISRICNGLQVVELAAEGKLIRTTVHHISQADNPRALQQLNRAHLLKTHRLHLQMTTIRSGHPKTYKLKIRV